MRQWEQNLLSATLSLLSLYIQTRLGTCVRVHTHTRVCTRSLSIPPPQEKLELGQRIAAWGDKEGIRGTMKEGFARPAEAPGSSVSVLLVTPRLCQGVSPDPASPDFRTHEGRNGGCLGAHTTCPQG